MDIDPQVGQHKIDPSKIDPHEIDQSIEKTWRKLRPQILSNPAELKKRLARRRSSGLTRPPRPWCLAIRASDHRITRWASAIYPAHRFTDRHPAAQEITLTRDLIHNLCKPVIIHYPGEELTDVAAKLGISPVTLRRARISGLLRARYVPGLGGKHGRPVPILYTEKQLDPNANLFAEPDPAWIWTVGLCATTVPLDFQQELVRVPCIIPRGPSYRDTSNLHPEHPELDPPQKKKISLRIPPPPPDYVSYKWKDGVYMGYDWRNPYAKKGYERAQRAKQKRHQAYLRRRKAHPPPSTSKGSLEFRGFLWLCPDCAQTCRTLYAPYRRSSILFECDPDTGQLRDVVPDPDRVPPPPMHFACGDCHRVRFITRAQNDAWNDIITYLSGGLLYGREVPKPTWFTPDRKRPYKPLINAKPAIQRQRVESLLLQGLSRTRIAQKLGMTKGAVDQQAYKIFKQHRVRTQRQLLRKSGRKLPDRLILRQDQVKAHLAKGLSQRQVASAMGITLQAVQQYVYKLRKLGQLARPKRKREAVAGLLSQGLSNRQIAARLGISLQNVYDHRSELIRAGQLPTRNRANDRKILLKLLLTDLTFKEIGARLKEKPGTVAARATRIYRNHGAKNRQALQRTISNPQAMQVILKKAKAQAKVNASETASSRLNAQAKVHA
jgi:DNA-binding CsgD family transcriptional regulator